MTEGLCECGCGQKTRIAPRNLRRLGWVKGRPIRFVRGHNDVSKVGRGLPEYEVQDRGHETPCWIWLGSTTEGGYGEKRASDGRVHPAHRVYYVEAVGPVPAGLELDHLCRVRSCVNPAHLEPVTRSANMMRSPLRFRKLNEEKVALIRSSAEPIGVLADRFGVTTQAIRYHRSRIKEVNA